MSKPRRSTKQEFYDVFADFDLSEQVIILEFLAEQHRQAKRWAAKQKELAKDPAKEPERTLFDGEGK